MTTHSIALHNNHAKTERLEARVSGEQKKLFKKAADLQGATLTDFIISSLQMVANKIIQEHAIMDLTGKDREIFMNALLNPKIPAGRLKKAIDEYKKAVD